MPTKPPSQSESPPTDPDSLQGEQKLRYFIDRCHERAADPDDNEWSMTLAPTLKVHSTSSSPTQKVTFTFQVQPPHLNSLGNMHGGCTATLFDLCTSSALFLVSRPGFWNYLGVSRCLNVTYLKPLPVGTRVLVECEVVSIGRRLAHLRGVICDDEGLGVVYATCEHTKVNTDPDVAKV
ncbi:putative thioesterase superfamily member [Echria macrotheca]|uniref:Thioesterase superfamily member n=1 Tax=Echria macrotheca TaxID=438768 RepID=A0AAJ0FCB2_9PEZI|nr:putative thioesterase superfamily member [Echria macrotheca]